MPTLIVFREINFTSVEPMEKFRLEQKVLFKVVSPVHSTSHKAIFHNNENFFSLRDAALRNGTLTLGKFFQ